MREQLFSHPEVIRAIADDFIPVSVVLPLLIRPEDRDPESLLFQSLYGERGGAQGFCVVGYGGKAIEWLPPANDHQHFLQLLRDALARFRDRPAEPGLVTVPLPHAADELCPLDPPLPAGVVVADFVGRAVDAQGKPSSDLSTQRGFARQTVPVPFSLRAILRQALELGKGAPKILLPQELSELLLSYGYMGVEDFRPYRNPLATTGAIPQAELWAFPTSESGAYRLEGSTEQSASGPVITGNRRYFTTSVKLRWRGWLEMGKDAEIRRLLLLGEGRTTLVSQGSMSRLPGVPEPLGTSPVDLASDVRMGFTIPGKGRLRDPGTGIGSPSGDITRRLRRVQERMHALDAGGIDLDPVLRLLQAVEPLLWKGERERVDKVLDQVEKALDRLK